MLTRLLPIALALLSASGWSVGARAQGSITGGLAVSGRADTTTLPLIDALAELSAASGLRFSYEATALADVRVGAAFAKTWDALRDELADRGFVVQEAGGGSVLLARRPVTSAGERIGDAGDDGGAGTLALLILGHQGERLTGATVTLPDGTGGVADERGRVRLPAPTSTLRAEANYLGYLKRAITLSPGVNQQTVQLWPDTVAMALVEVTAPLPPRDWRRDVSSAALGRSPTLLPALLAPVRTLEGYGFSALAGASQIDAAGAGPAIRGSAHHETRVELDGLPLYHVDHLFGLFSAIDPALVSAVEVYRSHYPADRGGARGGLMAVSTADAGASDAPALELGVSSVSANAALRAGAGSVCVLAGARSSLGDVGQGGAFAASGGAADETLTATGVPAFRFHDAYVRVDVGAEDSPWHARLNAYRSRDRYNYGLDEASLLEDRRVPTTLTLGYEEASRWRNDGFGASLTYASEGLTYGLDAHVSRYGNALTTGATASVSPARRPQVRERELLDNALDNEIEDLQIGLRVGGSSADRPWEVGMQVQRLSTLARFWFDTRRTFEELGDEIRLHVYGMRAFRLAEGTDLEFGLRGSYSRLFGEAWASPRVMLRQEVLAKAKPDGKATGRTYLTGGYSYTRQSVTALQHQNQFGQNYDLLVLELPSEEARGAAHNLTFGATHERTKLRIGLEAYYRALPGVVANLSTSRVDTAGRALLNPQPTFQTVVGEGEVVGVDVDAAYQRGRLSGTLAYTLSRSRQRFDAINRGTWLNAPDDRRHRLAATQAYRLGRWTAGVDYEAASGLVYNDLDAVIAEPRLLRRDPDQFQERLPAYHRVDLRASYRWTPSWGEVTVGARLHNALDRLNVSQRAYVIGLGPVSRGQSLAVGTDVGLLRRLLVGEVRVGF